MRSILLILLLLCNLFQILRAQTGYPVNSDEREKEIKTVCPEFSKELINKQKKISRNETFIKEISVLDSVQIFDRDTMLDKWIMMFEEKNTYDALGRICERVPVRYSYNGNIIRKNKDSFRYDDNSFINERISSKWDIELNDWVYSTKKQSVKVSEEQVLEETLIVWDTALQEWLNTEKYLYEYSVSGKLSMQMRTRWSKSLNDWVNVFRRSYFFDENDYNTGKKDEEWYVGTSSWQNISKVDYTNDAYGNVMMSEEYLWNNSGQNWGNYSKSVGKWDSSKTIYTFLNSKWNVASETWKEIEKGTQYFDSKNRWIGAEYHWWDDAQNDWYGKVKFWREYNDLNQLIGFGEYRWDFETKQWYFWYKEAYSFTSNGDTDIKLGYAWDSAKENWYECYNKSWIYNSNDLCEGHTIEVRNYESDWFLVERKFQYWSTLTVADVSENVVKYKVYPNPANEYINIEFTTQTFDNIKVEVFNLDGKLLGNQLISNGNAVIDVGYLKPGVYILKINNGESIRSEQLIIK